MGDIKDQLNESMASIASKVKGLKEIIKRMQSTELSFEQCEKLMRFAADLRLKDVKGLYTVELNTIDRLRREADKGQDLYTVFNRIQESVIKGGIRYTAKVEVKDDLGIVLGHKINKNTTRKVRGITKSIELNTKLWREAEKVMA